MPFDVFRNLADTFSQRTKHNFALMSQRRLLLVFIIMNRNQPTPNFSEENKYLLLAFIAWCLDPVIKSAKINFHISLLVCPEDCSSLSLPWF